MDSKHAQVTPDHIKEMQNWIMEVEYKTQEEAVEIFAQRYADALAATTKPGVNIVWEAKILNQELDKLNVPTCDAEDRYTLWGRVKAALAAEATRMRREAIRAVRNFIEPSVQRDNAVEAIRALADKG